MHPSFFIRRSLGIAAIACALPTFVFAASPRQELTASLTNSLAYTPLHIDGSATINVTTKPVAKGSFATTGSAHITITDRIVSRDPKNKQSEGMLSLDSFTMQTKGPGAVPALDAPLALDWKKTNQMMYLRIHELPASLTNSLNLEAQAQDALQMLVNQWISINLTEVPSESGVSSIADIGMKFINPTSGSSLVTTLYGKASPLIFTGTEKKFTAADGTPILRVRARINPSFITKMRNDELTTLRKEPATDAMERSIKNQSIKDANNRFAQLRRIIAATKLAVNINTKSHLIQRIEIGGTVTQPNQDCTTKYGKTAVTTCRTTTKDTMTFTAGFTIKKDSGSPIVAPTDSRSIMEILTQLQSSMMPSETTTSTTP